MILGHAERDRTEEPTISDRIGWTMYIHESINFALSVIDFSLVFLSKIFPFLFFCIFRFGYLHNPTTQIVHKFRNRDAEHYFAHSQFCLVQIKSVHILNTCLVFAAFLAHSTSFSVNL